MKRTAAALLLASLAVLTGCSDNGSSSGGSSNPDNQFTQQPGTGPTESPAK